MVHSLADAAETTALRPPATVMRLSRLGAFFPTRLSFMRTLVRRIAREDWSFEETQRSLDENGYGHMAWRIGAPGGVLSFVAFSSALEPEDRTDRVIAEKWDACFTLVSGDVDDDDIKRLAGNVPKQEAGRCSVRELVLSRANKSVRLFEHVVCALASGKQPDAAELAAVGYLMRTTAVYGNGKFGLGDYPCASANPSIAGPFQAEMLIVFMIRMFQVALVNHVARQHGGETAVELAPDLARNLGIGNSTGLGMAPFIIRHPVLFHHWIAGRETALARVRGIVRASADKIARYQQLLDRAGQHVGEWNVDDERQQARIVLLRRELEQIAGFDLANAAPWNELFRAVENQFSEEAQELVASLLIELYPELADDLEAFMGESAAERIDGSVTCAELKSAIERNYDWALAIDFDDKQACRQFWYYSEGKEEPRLGDRYDEPGADREMRLAMGCYVHQLHQHLSRLDAAALAEPVAAYALKHPEHRLAIRRVATVAAYPYAEIRDNTIGADLLAIDMLRCKLSFFGATKFDPRSDKWTRITLFQGAPLLAELDGPDADDWWLPVVAIP